MKKFLKKYKSEIILGSIALIELALILRNNSSLKKLQGEKENLKDTLKGYQKEVSRLNYDLGKMSEKLKA